ncbi:LOW QUALITY PROTEIN: hypothetical protein HID58_037749 [Brassica napus]|uniref:Uncharacterized protein n=1 Tax=Brassica napus TaxID=3708 RepID=A0ABQ8BM94_BRANA|nr:LOW QUALITY PROTEIN: hypothetical protein HID58_037749 [Brassica napus]
MKFEKIASLKLGHALRSVHRSSRIRTTKRMRDTWLTVKEKPIFWQKLYELDVVAREFSKKKDKGKVNEEASSSNHGVEDILKGLKQRLMTGFSEVCVKVETMDKRLNDVPAMEKTDAAEETSRIPAHSGVRRGRPRKAEKPQKFTTPPPPPTKITRHHHSIPFTEANTDEIEGRKKKPITKA